MSFNSQTWLVQYERLKLDFQAKKKISMQIAAGDCQDFLGKISQLDYELSIMRESPMQYEL
jgi:hypothetical protein